MCLRRSSAPASCCDCRAAPSCQGGGKESAPEASPGSYCHLCALSLQHFTHEPHLSVGFQLVPLIWSLPHSLFCIPTPGAPYLMSWLYLARRSDLQGAPVFICKALPKANTVRHCSDLYQFLMAGQGILF